MKMLNGRVKWMVGIYLILVPAMAFAQEAKPPEPSFGPLFFPVPAFADNVTIVGEHFKFSQAQAEYEIGSGLDILPDFQQELAAADSEQAKQTAQGHLERLYLDLAYNIIAVELFATKSDELLALLQKVKDTLKDHPLPPRVVTPRQYYLAIGENSFSNPKGYRMDFGLVTEILTFGDLVAEARGQILYRSETSKR